MLTRRENNWSTRLSSNSRPSPAICFWVSNLSINQAVSHPSNSFLILWILILRVLLSFLMLKRSTPTVCLLVEILRKFTHWRISDKLRLLESVSPPVKTLKTNKRTSITLELLVREKTTLNSQRTRQLTEADFRTEETVKQERSTTDFDYFLRS